MQRFELEKLTSYDDQSLINEVKRVAALIPGNKLKSNEYNRFGKVNSSTLIRRFGGWRKALAAAGLEHRFEDKSEAWSREEVIEKLQQIARRTGRTNVTAKELAEEGITSRPIRRLFGPYRKALEAAGLSQARLGRRYTDEECFENLLNVWTILGRQPAFSEIERPPSRVGTKAYVSRWGSWRKALAAFVERVNQDTETVKEEAAEVPPITDEIVVKRTARSVTLGLRYTVLKRDRFRCVICGRSPATDQSTELHVDHYKAWSKDGETVLSNLRSLCRKCNLGKGARDEDEV